MALLVRQALRLSAWVFLSTAMFAEAASIQSVRLWRAPDNTRLVFDLSGPAEHKLLSLPGEKGQAQRIVIHNSMQMPAKSVLPIRHCLVSPRKKMAQN